MRMLCKMHLRQGFSGGAISRKAQKNPVWKAGLLWFFFRFRVCVVGHLGEFGNHPVRTVCLKIVCCPWAMWPGYPVSAFLRASPHSRQPSSAIAALGPRAMAPSPLAGVGRARSLARDRVNAKIHERRAVHSRSAFRVLLFFSFRVPRCC